MARISQMEGRIQRHCERSKRELRKLQQERTDQPEPDPPAAPTPEPGPPEEVQAPESAATLQPGNGQPSPSPGRDP